MIHELFFKDHFPNIIVRSYEEADAAYEELKLLIASKERSRIPDFVFLYQYANDEWLGFFGSIS